MCLPSELASLELRSSPPPAHPQCGPVQGRDIQALPSRAASHYPESQQETQLKRLGELSGRDRKKQDEAGSVGILCTQRCIQKSRRSTSGSENYVRERGSSTSLG